MAVRIEADDEIRRFVSVWLGPPGWALPFRIRYIAYGLWFTLFLAILLFEAITPLHVGVPPVWEFTIAVLTTNGLMMAVDHDKPLTAVVQNLVNVATAPGHPRPLRAVRPSLGRTVKTTKDPIGCS